MGSLAMCLRGGGLGVEAAVRVVRRGHCVVRGGGGW